MHMLVFLAVCVNRPNTAEQRKEESRKLLRGLLFVLRDVLKCPNVFCCFEWPAYCQGWNSKQLPEILELQQLLPHSSMCDGCSFGLKVRKRWKLHTNMLLLAEHFSHFYCDKTHEHLQCRGKLAAASAFYTQQFVEEVLKVVKSLPALSHSLQPLVTQPAADEIEDEIFPEHMTAEQRLQLKRGVPQSQLAQQQPPQQRRKLPSSFSLTQQPQQSHQPSLPPIFPQSTSARSATTTINFAIVTTTSFTASSATTTTTRRVRERSTTTSTSSSTYTTTYKRKRCFAAQIGAFAICSLVSCVHCLQSC